MSELRQLPARLDLVRAPGDSFAVTATVTDVDGAVDITGWTLEGDSCTAAVVDGAAGKFTAVPTSSTVGVRPWSVTRTAPTVRTLLAGSDRVSPAAETSAGGTSVELQLTDTAAVVLSVSSGDGRTDLTLDQALAGGVVDVADAATQRLYAKELVGGRALAVDPAVSGRVWFARTSDGALVFSDDYGDTFTLGSANPTAQSMSGLYFNASYAFLLTSGTGSREGQLWRSPLPAADGTGLSWTKIHDLTGMALGPGGATTDGGANSFYRNSCFAVNGQQALLVEYGTTITGGPSVYFCANINVAAAGSVLWTKRHTFTDAKHGHAAGFGPDGAGWVSLGDAGPTWDQVGLWAATVAVNQSAWAQQSLYGEAAGGTTYYPIRFVAVTVSGEDVWVMESDSKRGVGPLVYNSVEVGKSLPIVPMFDIPAPYKGTMRQLTLTSEGNLMWVTTGENGAVGPLDSVWISKPPFRTAVLLDSFASVNTLGTLGDGVEAGGYVYFGAYRVAREKFVGQA